MEVLRNTGTALPERSLVGSDETEVGLFQAASGTPIMNPDAEYLARTTKIDISELPFNSTHDFISDGTMTVSFSTPVEKRGPVPDGWQTWSSPPFSEDPNPDVLLASQSPLTLELSSYARTFGFELEPDAFQLQNYTVDFYADDYLVESITREVQGNAGARLFARTGNTAINRVVITGPTDFAIAQIRYELGLSPQAETFLLTVILVVLVLAAAILLA